MPEKDKKKKFEKISLETAYIDEQQVKTGNIEKHENLAPPAVTEVEFCINGEQYKFQYDTNEEKPELNWETMRNEYKSGVSTHEIYTKLKQEVLSHKNNPEYIELIIANLLNDIEYNLYDSKQRHENIGNTAEEMLNTMLNVKDDEELKGFVCSNIHEFGMRLLNDCGMNAVVLCGKAYKGEAHATLLYQRPDGKYVHTNYSESLIIDAPSIKDAAKAVYKNSMHLESYGWLTFIDDNGSYQEYALKDEACWGEELDKRFYNNESLFSRRITEKSGIDGNISYSGLGNISAELSFIQTNHNRLNTRETTYSLGYKQNGEGALFDNSKSIGIKFEKKGANNDFNGKTFWGTKVICDYTQGRRTENGVIYSNEKAVNEINQQIDSVLEKHQDYLKENGYTNQDFHMPVNNTYSYTRAYDTKHVTGFFRGFLGREDNIGRGADYSLKNVARLSLTGGVNMGVSGDIASSGDVRFAAEDGIEITNYCGNTVFKNGISGGITGDLRLTNGKQIPGIQPGGKFNFSSHVNTTPADNLVLEAGLGGCAVISKPAKDFGLKGSLSAIYQPENSRISFFGKAEAEYANQHLNLGGFKQKTENITTLGAIIGANLNKKTSIHAGYNRTFDKLNSTKNKSIITLGVRINL